MERKDLGVAEAPDRRAVDRRTERVRGIEKETEAALFREFWRERPAGRRAPEIDAHDRADVAVDQSVDLFDVDLMGGRINVAEHRFKAGPRQRLDRGDEGEGRKDHLPGQVQGVGHDHQAESPVGDADRVLDLKEVPELRLELSEKRSVVVVVFPGEDAAQRRLVTLPRREIKLSDGQTRSNAGRPPNRAKQVGDISCCSCAMRPPARRSCSGARRSARRWLR